jgi:hypothetical protein
MGKMMREKAGVEMDGEEHPEREEAVPGACLYYLPLRFIMLCQT